MSAMLDALIPQRIHYTVCSLLEAVSPLFVCMCKECLLLHRDADQNECLFSKSCPDVYE
jgi:hypothetical protein